MTSTTLKTASVLAFERKLANSDAFMSAGDWADIDNAQQWQALKIQSKDVRGVISNRLKNPIANDPVKLDAEIQKANLQRVDVAALPQATDTLKLSFTLRVLGNLSTPSVCNSPDYQKALVEKIESYVEQQQFSELANRYAENIANGRFLWRNRVGAEEIKIVVRHVVDQKAKQTWHFNAHDFNLRSFTNSPVQNLSELATVVQQGLLGKSFVLLEVDAYARLGKSQEVFPSQELVLDGGRDSAKSKYLYDVDGVAAMHSQKIGNALRTVDSWYPDEEGLGPIAIEPYGSVTSRGTAYRQPKQKMDFYSLLDKWVLKDEMPELEQQHYVIATLIRGGVFGEAS